MTNKTRVIRPQTGTDGMITALSMVKAFLADGVSAEALKQGKLAAQLTDAERAELGW